MKAQALAGFPLPWLTAVGFLLFFGFFIGMLIWIYRKNSGEFYRVMADLPIASLSQTKKESEDGRNV